MKILFLTISRIDSIYSRGIYKDLMRKFRDEGHEVFIVSPTERRFGKKTRLIKTDGVTIVNVKTLNLKKTNVFEKGIGTLFLEFQFLNIINKYFSNLNFDLILYSTPPITFTKVIKAIKKRDNARSYLLLKDIFPQNAVDLGMIRENGLLHKFFRQKETSLYAISDFIGCMSPGNVNYVKKHNPQINPEIIEENPNSIELKQIVRNESSINAIRQHFNLPLEKTLFIYGGNLGKPQGIEFLMETIEVCSSFETAFFVVVGSGTEYPRILNWFNEKKVKNAILLKGLPKQDYDNLVKACDVGMIFLDKRFTIPNYPSRVLSYLENSMPIIAATDANSDIGKIAVDNGYGLWALSGDIVAMKEHVKSLLGNHSRIAEMGEMGHRFMRDHYTVEQSYLKIMKHF